MDNIDLYELIERYLLGITSPEETAEIEKRMESDPSFAKEVRLNRDMQALVTDHSLINIKQDLRKIRTSRIAKIKSRNKFYRNILIGGSGVIIITMSYLLFFNKENIAVRPVPETSEVSGTFSDTSLHLSEKEELTKAGQVKEQKTAVMMPDVNKARDTMTDKKVPGDYSVPDSTIDQAPKAVEKAGRDEDKSMAEPAKPHTDGTEITAKEKQEIPCNLTAEYLTEPSCNNKATGLIKFIESSVSGGTAPYQFAVKGIFSDSLVFRDLLPGLYNIAIKDASDCIKEWKNVEIEKINCYGEFKFAPLYGEIWEIPFEKGYPGVLTVTNKNGIIVYQLEFDGLSELTWNGMSINNQMLPMGAYPFVIKYQNGKVFRGTITIVK
ncbi:MAG: hypothetical protein JSV22_10415 [Bacteroidales bacterium]|nr:MAG: hypothetical protein JSV22_10415 [Bacteroidales bacterium]